MTAAKMMRNPTQKQITMALRSPRLTQERRNVIGNSIGHISTDFGGDRSRHNEIVRIVLLYGFEVIAGANLPVFDGKFGKIPGRITNAPLVDEYKVGMTGEAARE